MNKELLAEVQLRHSRAGGNPALLELPRTWIPDNYLGNDRRKPAAPQVANGLIVMSLLLLLLLLGLLTPALAADPEEIIRKSQAALFYPGQDFKARVLMTLISASGQERRREMTMLRLNTGEVGGEQKYFIYFLQPADVKNMTFMVYKYPAKDDDRWLFVPALNMVRRIAMQDKQASFVGSDFTYEDVSGRDLGDDSHELRGEEMANGRSCFVIRSTPRAGTANYAAKLSWIDQATFLPIREEYLDREGAIVRAFAADEIQEIKGIPTIIRRSMRNLKSGHRTEVFYKSVDYNLGLDTGLFSERFLKQPPRKWVD
jgi:outer membrane lipoprotein-sorting protein